MSNRKASIWAIVIVLLILGLIVLDATGYGFIVFLVVILILSVILWWAIKEILKELF